MTFPSMVHTADPTTLERVDIVWSATDHGIRSSSKSQVLSKGPLLQSHCDPLMMEVPPMYDHMQRKFLE